MVVRTPHKFLSRFLEKFINLEKGKGPQRMTEGAAILQNLLHNKSKLNKINDVSYRFNVQI